MVDRDVDIEVEFPLKYSEIEYTCGLLFIPGIDNP
jgi:hypothetical protein